MGQESESRGDAWWAPTFWAAAAARLARCGELAPGLVAVLEAHGYGGGDPARARAPVLAVLGSGCKRAGRKLFFNCCPSKKIT